VFANPWAGTTKDGEARDGIAEFLLSVNRAPKVGEEPDWKRLVGAKGRCRLKVEVAQVGALAGSQVNRVAYFHAPRQVEAQLKEQQKKPVNKINPASEDPDEIPF
jgi:hypothetical protein